jgi:hypothetical protein
MLTTDKLKHSFKLFLRLLWKSLGLPPPTRAQLAMADYLQYGPTRRQLRCFRGLGKSWVAAAFSLWRLFRDPDRKIMVVSASKQRADDFTIFCQKCLQEVEWLHHMIPDSDEQRWSRVSFDVANAKPAQSPSMKSVGITGQMAGGRAHDIIFDDVEIPGNSATDLMREKLIQLVSEGESVLIPHEDCTISFLGTPQTVFTIYKTLEERGYVPFVWPARYPLPDQLVQYGNNLADDLQGDIDKHGIEALQWKPTDTRFSDETLQQRESSMTKSNFMLQFQLDTSLSDMLKFPLRISDIPVMPLDAKRGPTSIVWRADREHVLDLPAVALPGDRWYRPAEVGQTVEWNDTIVAVDPSGRGRDETVAWILSQINGLIYARDVYTSTDGYSDETLRSILRMAKRRGAKRCVIESNFGDGLVMEVMKKHGQEMGIGLEYEEVRQSVRKEDRIIDTLELIMSQHRLILDQAIVEWDYNSNKDQPIEERLPRMLSYQLTRMCREKGAVKYDDRVDALALGVKYFEDVFAVSAQEAIKEDKRQEWNAMIDMLQNDPERATDLLVLGVAFNDARTQSGKVFSML